NTMIVNRADTFGLAQLYQLRGRIGRSYHRAYAYLLIPGEHLITPEAQKRLRVLQELDDLGGGFRLAAHDLEIRGAGNLLGKQQSGHISAVGPELYTPSLEQAVRARGGRRARVRPPHAGAARAAGRARAGGPGSRAAARRLGARGPHRGDGSRRHDRRAPRALAEALRRVIGRRAMRVRHGLRVAA